MSDLPIQPISQSVVSVPHPVPSTDPTVVAAGGTPAPSAGQAGHDAAHMAGRGLGWGARKKLGIAKTITNAEKAHWGPSADLAPKAPAVPPPAPPMITGTPVNPLDVSTDPLVQNELRRAREGQRGT
jgi:hypothetical protein